MTVGDEVLAIRQSVAFSWMDEVRLLRVRGRDALEALDHLCPGELYVRDGQLLHTLFLDETAHLVADVYVGCDDEEYFVLAECASAAVLDDHLSRHVPAALDVTIEDHTAAHCVLALDGPYAWELLGEVAGQEAIGLPYLTFFHVGDWLCVRAGKTGEYGYAIIAPAREREALAGRVWEAGAALDLVEATLEARDVCALENWFLNIRREGREPVTPLELQLQWRVSYGKPCVGADALAQRRRERPHHRLTCLVGDGPLALGSDVALDGATVGRIVNAAFSPVRAQWVALALIERAWAHPRLEFQVEGAASRIRAVSPPVVNNRSLHVSPQLHSYATRGDYSFPPLVRGAP